MVKMSPTHLWEDNAILRLHKCETRFDYENHSVHLEIKEKTLHFPHFEKHSFESIESTGRCIFSYVMVLYIKFDMQEGSVVFAGQASTCIAWWVALQIQSINCRRIDICNWMFTLVKHTRESRTMLPLFKLKWRKVFCDSWEHGIKAMFFELFSFNLSYLWFCKIPKIYRINHSI